MRKQPSAFAEPTGAQPLHTALVDLVGRHPGADIPVLARHTGASHEAVQACLTELTEHGAVIRRGRRGYYRWYLPGQPQRRETHSAQLVTSYLDDHPDSQTKDVAAFLGRDPRTAYNRLRVMREAGDVETTTPGGSGRQVLWRLSAASPAPAATGQDEHPRVLPSERVRQTVAEHPHATAEDIADLVGTTVVPVAAHLARLFWEGTIPQLPTQAWPTAPEPAAPAPHRRSEPAPSPVIGAAARALHERAAALEATEQDPGREPAATATGLRAAVLRDIAEALETAAAASHVVGNR